MDMDKGLMDWRQFGFKSIAIWRMLRYKFGGKVITHNHFNFVTFFQSLEEMFCHSYHGLKTIWFQINGHLEDTKVQVWRPNDNYQI